MIDQLDLCGIEDYYEREQRSYPPSHPHMMTKLPGLKPPIDNPDYN